MKTTLAVIAAALSLAIAAPSFAGTGTAHATKSMVVKHKKAVAKPKHKLAQKHKPATLHCKKNEKIELVNGKKQCVAK